MQEAFNIIVASNKLDIAILLMLVVQMVIGFVQGYKKSIYHSIKYVVAYMLTRMTYKVLMPGFASTTIYRGFKESIENFMVDNMPNNFDIISLYPIDRYLFNLIIFLSMLIFLRLVILGWHTEVGLVDRILGVMVGIAKVVVITTIIVLIITPFVDSVEPITGSNMINDSKVVSFMKTFNPFLNGTRIEF